MYIDIYTNLYLFSIGLPLLTISGRALGYLVGSVLCGVLYSRFNPELQISVAGVVQAIPVIMAPFLPILGLYITAIVFHRVACGFIDTGKWVQFIIDLYMTIFFYSNYSECRPTR